MSGPQVVASSLRDVVPNVLSLRQSSKYRKVTFATRREKNKHYKGHCLQTQIKVALKR